MAKELNFEEKLKNLEELVSSLDKDELTLDESIKIFEEGIKLSKECSEEIEKAEKKINILLEDSSTGELKEERFIAED